MTCIPYTADIVFSLLLSYFPLPFSLTLTHTLTITLSFPSLLLLTPLIGLPITSHTPLLSTLPPSLPPHPHPIPHTHTGRMHGQERSEGRAVEEMGVTNRSAPRLSRRISHRCCAAMVRTHTYTYMHMYIHAFTFIHTSCIHVYMCYNNRNNFDE